MGVRIEKDNELLHVAKDENDAFVWLLRHQSSSVSHALKHEGYRFVHEPSIIVVVAGGVLQEVYSQLGANFTYIVLDVDNIKAGEDPTMVVSEAAEVDGGLPGIVQKYNELVAEVLDG